MSVEGISVCVFSAQPQYRDLCLHRWPAEVWWRACGARTTTWRSTWRISRTRRSADRWVAGPGGGGGGGGGGASLLCNIKTPGKSSGTLGLLCQIQEMLPPPAPFPPLPSPLTHPCNVTKGPFTHAIFDSISRTKRALPYPARMPFSRSIAWIGKEVITYYLKTPFFPISANLAVFCRSVTRLKTARQNWQTSLAILVILECASMRRWCAGHVKITQTWEHPLVVFLQTLEEAEAALKVAEENCQEVLAILQERQDWYPLGRSGRDWSVCMWCVNGQVEPILNN